MGRRKSRIELEGHTQTRANLKDKNKMREYFKLLRTRHAYMRQAIVAHLLFVIPCETVLVNWTKWFNKTDQLLSEQIALCFVLIGIISGSISILYNASEDMHIASKISLNAWTFLAGASVGISNTIFTVNGYHLGGKASSWQAIFWWVSLGMWALSFGTMIYSYFIVTDEKKFTGNGMNDFDVEDNVGSGQL